MIFIIIIIFFGSCKCQHVSVMFGEFHITETTRHLFLIMRHMFSQTFQRKKYEFLVVGFFTHWVLISPLCKGQSHSTSTSSLHPGRLLCAEQSVVELCPLDPEPVSVSPCGPQAQTLPQPVRLDPLTPEVTPNSVCSLTGQSVSHSLTVFHSLL